MVVSAVVHRFDRSGCAYSELGLAPPLVDYDSSCLGDFGVVVPVSVLGS